MDGDDNFALDEGGAPGDSGGRSPPKDLIAKLGKF